MLWRPLASSNAAFFLAALAGALTSCNQQSYPIAATVCDQWCNVNDQNACARLRNDDPVNCVLECEETRKPEEPECVPMFSALVECLQNLPSDQSCSGDYAASCFDEERATIDCIFERSEPNAPEACVDWCKVNARSYYCAGYELNPYDFRAVAVQSCVADCAQHEFPNEPECVPAFEHMVQCSGSLPIEQVCNPSAIGLPGYLSCAADVQTLITCEIDTSYPDNPTLCDDWCNAQGVFCPDFTTYNVKFDRRNCVDNCNATVLPKKPECVPLLREATECLSNPSTACDWDAGSPCADRFNALAACDN